MTGRKSPNVDVAGLDVLDIASAVYDFLSATRRLCERPIQKLGSSQSEIEVLHFVFNHPGSGVSEIARLRFLRPSNVSATVRRLINDGLLERRMNDKDKRAQNLYVTPDGEEVLGELSNHWATLIAQATSHMKAEDVSVLRKGVGALQELAKASEILIDDIQRNPESYGDDPGEGQDSAQQESAQES